MSKADEIMIDVFGNIRAVYFKIEYRSTSLLPNDTLIVLARKEIFKTNYNMSFGWIGGEDD